MGLDESLEGWLAIPSQLRTQRGDVLSIFHHRVTESQRKSQNKSLNVFWFSLCLCVSVVSSRDFQHDLTKVFSFGQQSVCFWSLFIRKHVSDHRMQPAVRDPLRKLLPRLIHQLTFSGKICQP